MLLTPRFSALHCLYAPYTLLKSRLCSLHLSPVPNTSFGHQRLALLNQTGLSVRDGLGALVEVIVHLLVLSLGLNNCRNEYEFNKKSVRKGIKG